MDKSEARQVLSKHLASFRGRSYEQLVGMIGTISVVEIRGPSGAEYQIEVEVFWDSPKVKTNVRVLGAIDDGRFFAALTPLTDSFALGPDGKIVGE
jgi:hypothetical protein